MRIIFMGTPEIAVHSLDIIDQSKHKIVAVITSPDKPAGRGQKLRQSAVKQFAEQKHIRLFQPEKLKNNEFIDKIRKLNADLFVVVAFRMLPKEIWSLPNKGTINLHASLLPNYRGAAPINWAIINGEKKTGVTTFFIDDKIDTGRIIKQKEIEITNDDNAGTLHDKIMIEGANLLLETIELLDKNIFVAVEQENMVDKNMQLKPAPKIFKADCKIDWNRNASEIYNFIRGLNPYPGAWTTVLKDDKEYLMKIFDVEFIQENHNFENKTIIIEKQFFKIVLKNGFIKVNTMQFQGKKRMKSGDFLRGFNFSSCKLN